MNPISLSRVYCGCYARWLPSCLKYLVYHYHHSFYYYEYYEYSVLYFPQRPAHSTS